MYKSYILYVYLLYNFIALNGIFKKKGTFSLPFFLNIKLAIHELLNNKKIKIYLVKYLYSINSGENDTELD